jgi:hypothetical protein
MKITKPAHLFSTVEFKIECKCSFCGCEFTIETEDEYLIKYSSEYEQSKYSPKYNQKEEELLESYNIRCPTVECKRLVPLDPKKLPSQVNERLKKGIKSPFKKSYNEYDQLL